MQAREVVPGTVVNGPGLDEAVEIFASFPETSGLRVAAIGLATGTVLNGFWTTEQVSGLIVEDRSALTPAGRDLLTPTSLPMPAGPPSNFWYLQNASDTVVVFVHGIFSNGRTSWLHKEGGRWVYWPDLVRVDPRIDTPSIFVAGYHTALEAGAFPLAQCARQVLEAIERPDLFGRPRVLDKTNIVFLCHSTGGIVIRYLLLRYGKALAGKGVGLALLASPSRGSVWANVAGIAARYYNQRLGQQLRWGGDDIEEIHNRFKDLVNARESEMPGLFGMEACETRMVFRAVSDGLATAAQGRLDRIGRPILRPSQVPRGDRPFLHRQARFTDPSIARILGDVSPTFSRIR